MKRVTLPHSNLEVSEICLGTMTFGNQNSETEAHYQMDYAFERGINFFDTAEMYPIGGNAQIVGNTERYIGSWFKKSGKRDKIVLATKIAGPNRGLEYIRKPLDFSKKSLTEAIDLSLKNLQTDCIDLYQFHWPERVMNMFGKRGIQNVDMQWEDNIFEVLTIMQEFITQGKIKHIGVSNENPWGLMKFLNEAEKHNLPRVVSIQNPYSLLNRLFEVGLSEICVRENVGLLAYSPLGFGVLSGKHINGIVPDSRLGLFPNFVRYTSVNCQEATKKYQSLAHDLDLTLTELALAFVHAQEFVTSTIIGATTLDQLEENINAFDVMLTNEVFNEINKIQEMIPNPAP